MWVRFSFSQFTFPEAYAHFGDDVDAAQEQLVQVSVLHQLTAVNQGVFEAGPDLPSQLRPDVQPHAQVPQTHTGQVVHLVTETQFKALSHMTTEKEQLNETMRYSKA